MNMANSASSTYFARRRAFALRHTVYRHIGNVRKGSPICAIALLDNGWKSPAIVWDETTPLHGPHSISLSKHTPGGDAIHAPATASQICNGSPRW